MSSTLGADRSQHGILTAGSSWLLSGSVLAFGGGLPSLFLASEWAQVVALQPAYLVSLLLATDGLFILSATIFLLVGARFGEQRYGTGTQPYPGPFRESTGHVSPEYFKYYIRSVGLLGILVPVIAIAYLTWQQHAALALGTLGLYLLELWAQIRSERIFIRQGSVMWPAVPQVYQTYRLWQLMRGCALTRALEGPQWLWNLQAALIFIWYFNFGAVNTWMPWLYQWQLQPKTATSGKAQPQ